MASSSRPEPLPLTGADCFLRAFEAEVRRTGGASHLSQLVLRLGPGFDETACRRLLAEVAAANEILRAPIRRRRLLGAPEYRLDRPAAPSTIAVETHAPHEPARGSHAGAPVLGSLPDVFAQRLNSRMDARAGRLLRFDIVPRLGANPGTDIAATWLHMLFDGSGSEHFVEHLSACSADAQRSRVIAIDRGEGRVSSPAVAALPAGAGVRGKMAGQWQAYMNGLAARPPASLAGPLRRQRQELRYRQLRLDGDEGRAVIERGRKIAGFLTPMLFYLAVAVRAHRAVALRRGKLPPSWVVPLPVNMRPKGGQGEVFRTHVSLLWFQVTPEQAEDLTTLIEVLKAQRLEAIRSKLVEAGVAAMDFARIAPARLYSYMARRNFGGELASFFFAYTDVFAPEARSLCGAQILDGFHVPSVPTSPGSALVFCLRDGLDVIHVHQRGVVDEGELELMREQILSDLRG
ncbi:MAG TPA: hypothetical protein VEC57_10660 [Candidatus Limnocylindrales bacterium]|nr:hypothetical protein [Candidatus Limnocylindrales bacterium]